MAKIQPTQSDTFRATGSARKVIEHPSLPKPIVLWLFPLDDLRTLKARSIAAGLSARYIHGGWMDEEGQWQKEPQPYPEIAGVVPDLSDEALELMSRIEAMQDASKGDVYTVREDLIPWAVLNKEVFFAFQVAAREAMDDGRGKDAPKPVLATITTG